MLWILWLYALKFWPEILARCPRTLFQNWGDHATLMLARKHITCEKSPGSATAPSRSRKLRLVACLLKAAGEVGSWVLSQKSGLR